MLGWGIKAGVMPAKPLPVRQTEFPHLYWFCAAVLGLGAIGFLAAAFHQGLQAASAA
jgi:hypothetical protein